MAHTGYFQRPCLGSNREITGNSVLDYPRVHMKENAYYWQAVLNVNFLPIKSPKGLYANQHCIFLLGQQSRGPSAKQVLQLEHCQMYNDGIDVTPG